VFDSEVAAAEAYRTGIVDAVSGLSPGTAAQLNGLPGTRLLLYPGTTLMAVVLNLRPSHPEFREASIRRALLAAIDRHRLVSGPLGGFAVLANAPIPPSSWAYDPVASSMIEHDSGAAAGALEDAGWKIGAGGWTPPDAEQPLALGLLSPDASANPIAHEMAAAVVADWTEFGLDVAPVDASAVELGARARAGDFDALLLGVNIGLDPDLYPILASTQTTTIGSNIGGLQDADLDALLEAARGSGDLEARKAAYSALQVRLADEMYLLPLAFRDVVVVANDRLIGPRTRPAGDPADRFWDVLTWRLAVDR